MSCMLGLALTSRLALPHVENLDRLEQPIEEPQINEILSRVFLSDILFTARHTWSRLSPVAMYVDYIGIMFT